MEIKTKLYTALIALCIAISACKKVDDHYNDTINEPWAHTSYDQGYPKDILVGDTMTITGRIFISDGGYIQIGQVKANILSDKKTISSDGSTIDMVKFIITKEMGIGSVSVKVVTKGNTLLLPSINIRQFVGVPQRTDTTLYVEKIANFNPANLSYYKQNNIALLNNNEVDLNGTIWFDNPLGVFHVVNSSIQNVIHSGQSFTEGTTNFTIKRILGSVISYDVSTLYFSASVADNADTVNNYVFRLCKLNLIAGTVTTLNRTIVAKVAPESNILPGAFEGKISGLNVVAFSLRTDLNNNLYFFNGYLAGSPDTNPGFWYGYYASTGNAPFDRYSLNNICKLSTDGNVISLFSRKGNFESQNPIYKAPGFPIATTSDYKISADGTRAYVFDTQDPSGFNLGLMEFDLQKRAPVVSLGVFPSLKFLSYDNNPATKLTGNFTPIIFFTTLSNISNVLPLPDGSVLLASQSIASLDLLNKTAFLYAGTEVGIIGSTPPEQIQETGKAKNVLFSSNTAFAGYDKNGIIYYSLPITGNDFTINSIRFYRIYPKK